jgi:GTP-binding protein HflX
VTAPPGSLARPSPPRAGLVGLVAGAHRRLEVERSMEELAGLAGAAGAVPGLRLLQERSKPDPATFLGSGKLKLLGAACDEADIDLVVFDNELTPAQQRNLEAALDRPVLDRTQLILDIFARRARTREGRLQVELAQLKYLLPRLVGRGRALSRLGGGIGTRGPGETKLETDRRRIRHRISVLTRDLETVRRRRTHLRERRQKRQVPTVALVGYTNAGKTTLFNMVTGEHAPASDAPFVTLDPLIREVDAAPAGTFLLADTVGFVDRLPTTLVAAFRATLEEVAEADLLLHVIDASSRSRDLQRDAVRRTLDEVGAADVETLEVYNKCDLLAPDERRTLATRERGAIVLSALRGQGRQELLEAIAGALALGTRRVTLTFDERNEDDRRQLAQIYRHGRVLQHVVRGREIAVEAEVPSRLLDRLRSAPLRGAAGA